MPRSYILIAEDDADDRFLLETAFRECGFNDKLVFVENGIELIRYLDEEKNRNGVDRKFPAFIMLDLNMPKKDGREVLKELKENETYRVIPVVIFTTTKNENEIRRCYELGANSYVVKPVNFEHLVKVLGQIREYWFGISSAVE
jgi:two-component system response regulator